MKFTFKKERRETGLSGVGNPYPDTQIKLGGKEVGCIVAPSWQTKDGRWAVRFMVVHDIIAMMSSWKWVTLKARFDDEPAARKFVLDNEAQILGAFKLHQMED